MREHQKEKKRAKHGNEIMRESTKNWKKEKAQTRQRNYEGNQPKTTTKEDLERKKFLFMACLANLPTIPLASLNVCNETWQPLHTHIAMWGFLGPYILNLKSTLKSLNVSFLVFKMNRVDLQINGSPVVTEWRNAIY